MSIVCGLDLHRQQITFDAWKQTPARSAGPVWQPDRDRFRRWLTRDVARRQRRAGGDGRGGLHRLAVRGRGDRGGGVRGASGRAGRHAGGAGPQAARQDRSLRRPDVARVVAVRRAAESWIPPTDVLEWRERVRLYKSLVDQRRVWIQRFTPSCSSTASPSRRDRFARRTPATGCGRRSQLDPGRPSTGARRLRDARSLRRRSANVEARPAALRSSPTGVPGAGRSQLRHRRIDRRGGVVRARRLPPLLPLRQAVRHSGLDVSVDSSDRHRAHGYLSRQGPPTLRWALFEAAKNASHRRSPDHAYYTRVKDRHDGKLAAISVARQFARRCYHILRHLDPDVVYAMPA